jgi:hypothetical protein
VSDSSLGTNDYSCATTTRAKIEKDREREKN